MKTFAILSLVMALLSILAVAFFHLCAFKPRRILHTILKELRDGPKVPLQIEMATGLNHQEVGLALDRLEHELGFIRREAHPAIDPLLNPNASDLVHLTEEGRLEIGMEE